MFNLWRSARKTDSFSFMGILWGREFNRDLNVSMDCDPFVVETFFFM